MDDDLPKDKNQPFTLNGIYFLNRQEYDERVEKDANALAQLLYDIYIEKKRKDATSIDNAGDNTDENMV